MNDGFDLGLSVVRYLLGQKVEPGQCLDHVDGSQIGRVVVLPAWWRPVSDGAVTVLFECRSGVEEPPRSQPNEPERGQAPMTFNVGNANMASPLSKVL